MALPDLYILGAGNPGILKLIESMQRVVPVRFLKRVGPAFKRAVFLDDDEALWGTDILGYPVVGGGDMLAGLDPHNSRVVNNVARDTTLRQQVSERLAATGIPFASLVHPSVDATHVALGTDLQVSEGAILGARASVGDHSIVRNNALVNHDCVLEENVFVGPGVTTASWVRVGRGAFLGTGAVVVPGVSIGAFATVGAGAVVIRDVPDGVTVVGNPARTVGSGGR